MAYLQSTDIAVFPSTRRMNQQVSARLTTETSYVRTINKLIDTGGFVITPDPDPINWEENTDPFEFNVYGYYFVVDEASKIIDLVGQSDTEIYAVISLDETEIGGLEFYELSGQDVSTQYQGIQFLNAAGAGSGQKSLLLFRKVNNSWIVPSESRIKFYAFNISEIDGGEIE